MDWNELIITLLQGVMLPLIVWGLSLLKKWVDTNVRSKQMSDLLQQALMSAEVAVRQTNQTYVDNIKGTPEWNAQAQLEAKHRALETLKNSLGKSGIALLDQLSSDTNAYLSALIEATLNKEKQSAIGLGGDIF